MKQLEVSFLFCFFISPIVKNEVDNPIQFIGHVNVEWLKFSVATLISYNPQSDPVGE